MQNVLEGREKIRVLHLVPVAHPGKEKPSRTQYDEAKVHCQQL